MSPQPWGIAPGFVAKTVTIYKSSVTGQPQQLVPENLTRGSLLIVNRGINPDPTIAETVAPCRLYLSNTQQMAGAFSNIILNLNEGITIATTAAIWARADESLPSADTGLYVHVVELIAGKNPVA